MFTDIGTEVYQSWSTEKRRDEIGKLVQGYRAGVPVVVLCMTAAAVAGSHDDARLYLSEFMPLEERQAVVAAQHGADEEVQSLVRSFML